jgi:hypothetical protein
MKLKGRDEPIDVHEVLWREAMPENQKAHQFNPTSTSLG